jgi:hypothetical protein
MELCDGGAVSDIFQGKIYLGFKSRFFFQNTSILIEI